MVTRTNHPLGATPIAPDVPLGDGLANVAIAMTYERHCGCQVYFGVRTDNAEKAMLAKPCRAHRQGFDKVANALVADGNSPTPSRDTGELLDALIGAMATGRTGA